MRGLLYRSPDILIDGVAWHVVVCKVRGGKTVISYRFRRTEREAWLPVTSYPGRLPKGLAQRFNYYRRSINVALGNADMFARAA